VTDVRPAPTLETLPAIPMIDVGADFPFETLIAEEARAHALLDSATKGVPKRALAGLDTVSRRWLAKWDNAHLGEIDRIAERLARPGAYFLSVNYEWACTVGVRPTPDGRGAMLVRVLDWRTRGLGRHVIAARVAGAAGPFVTLTWPGYSGVLQAMAPGRFSAALNQAPMPKRGGGFYPFDWLANKVKVWQTPHETPAHLLRRAFEEAADFRAARALLANTPIASPAIFSLAGVTPGETAIIERTEDKAFVHDGTSAAANSWQAPGWRGRARGDDSAGRTQQMHCLAATLAPDFTWLAPPILNPRTRLAMVADARTCRLVAQGYEQNGPATRPLEFAV